MVLSVWISIISFISYLDLAHLANVIVDISEQNITSVPQNLLPNVTELNLENNLINILDATSFDLYRGLVWLSVAHNPLRRIKDGTFDKCRRLQTLLLSKTKITYLPIPFGPSVGKLGKLDLQRAIQDRSILRGEYLSGFANLKYLDLGMNSLNGMDDIVIPLSLESLNVAGNDITTFPDFTHLNMLKDLSIDTNPFTVISTNLFNGLSSLARLSMVSCNLSTFPDPTNLLSLRRIDLRNNNLFTVPDFLDSGVTDLRIARNPILCDYRMCWRRMWTWIKPLPSGFDDVTCQHPPGMRGQAIMDVSVVDIECYKGQWCLTNDFLIGRRFPYYRPYERWI